MPRLLRAYDALRQAYGPQRWWPSVFHDGRASQWEVCVGAVLVQHTSWTNVECALEKLAKADSFTPEAILATPLDRLADLVVPAGPQRVKARRLRALAEFVVERYGTVDRMLDGLRDARVARQRRRELLDVHGVGRETADAILLYAGDAPLFVVDAYLRRVMRRHGWGDADAPYDAVQGYWYRGLADGVPAADRAEAYNETHALIVRVGVEHCHARRPDCAGCPLESLLPRGGPRCR